MKKIFLCALCTLCCYAWADPSDMAQDILQQIIHGPVNANPDIADDVADQTVILSLKSASLNLACKQKNRGDIKAANSCIQTNKNSLLSIGTLSESSFDVGQLAAEQQSKIHREVTVGNYYQVINLLMQYAKNLYRSNIPNLPDIQTGT